MHQIPRSYPKPNPCNIEGVRYKINDIPQITDIIKQATGVQRVYFAPYQAYNENHYAAFGWARY